MRSAFIDALCELAERDPRVFLLTGDLGFSVLERFAVRFPERFVNVGVCEQQMTAAAAGLALSGKIVYTYSIANFPTLRCLEQIRNDVCYHHANVKIVAVGGGYTYGTQGYTHHGIEDLAILRALPEMTIVAPGDPTEARLATLAVGSLQGPCYLRIGKAGEPRVHASESVPFEVGRAITVRAGADVALLATGNMLASCVEAASELAARDGIEARVLSMHTVKPLDVEAVLCAARETGGILTAEEHTLAGGFGGAVAEALMDHGVRPRAFYRYGIPDRVSHTIGGQAFLRRRLGDIAALVRDMLGAE